MQKADSVSNSTPSYELQRAIPFVFAVVVSLLVAAPWLAPGFLFGTDWPGPRRFDFPSNISSAIPLQVVLALISRVVGSEWTGKLLVFAIVFGAAWTAFHAAPTASLIGRVAGATLFVFNPFVFGRLHYGQLYLLAAYALLPWAAHRLRLERTLHSTRGGLWFGVSAALVGVFSPHLLLVVSVLWVATLAADLLATKDRRRSALSLAVAAGTTLLLSSYWLVPLLLGRGAEAGVIAGTGAGQLQVYAAVSDRDLGVMPNLLGLFGFWAENSGRFTSMKDFVPAWPLALAMLIAVCTAGALAALRRGDDRLRAWVAGLIVAGAVGLILEMGVSNPLTSGLVRWLDSVVPLYRGMRDAGKWAALLALVYSQLLSLGVSAILDWIHRARLPAGQVDWLASTAVGVLIALPLFYGNGLLFGMHGEIKPSAYPEGWYAADRALAADPHPHRTLFLPWHLYMGLSFVHNENRVIGSPAPTFFTVPVVVSSDPEIGVAPPDNPDQRAISGLVRQGSSGDWSRVLADRDIKYVLVAREVDWKSYDFLHQTSYLSLVSDYGSITLYRNMLVA
ncbi:MAG TPA: hypothetical protein VJQ08_06615 [Candidatus Dormibacteraeota bacterium]|nr:hypothetical protein [Candidatus Dormibacteraeota bacterium]